MPFNFFGEKFRTFFGIPRYDEQRPDFRNDDWNSSWNDGNGRDPNTEDDYEESDDFYTFNDSLEFHRYFNQQFSNVMRLFGMQMFAEPFMPSENEHFFDDYNQNQFPEKRSIRDEYLKPGYKKSSDNSADSDLDGVIAPNDLSEYINKGQVPMDNFKEPRNNDFFGRVIITQSITRPDGSVETRRTVKDSKTNEEKTTVTITHKNDDLLPKISPGGSRDSNDPMDMWEKLFGNK